MTLRHEAIEAIRDLILSGELAGDTSEREILKALEKRKRASKLLEASRTPIREALAVLSHLGLVTQYPQRGIAVLRVTFPEAARSLRFRSAIESDVFGEFVEREPDEWKDALVKANQAVGEGRTVDQLMRAETRFHCIVPELLWLDEPLQSIRAYSDRLHLFRAQLAKSATAHDDTLADEAQAFASEHDSMISALAGGNQQRAWLNVDAHSRQILARLKDLAASQGLLEDDLPAYTEAQKQLKAYA
jgi:DNA-binding GntR family transcriptional regulator